MFRVIFNKEAFKEAHYVTTLDKFGNVGISMFSWWECKKFETALSRIDRIIRVNPKYKGLLSVEEFKENPCKK